MTPVPSENLVRAEIIDVFGAPVKLCRRCPLPSPPCSPLFDLSFVGGAALHAEVLALRHQLLVLNRQPSLLFIGAAKELPARCANFRSSRIRRRKIVGFEFALRRRAKEAERALEEACISRFGTLRRHGSTPVIRSDNRLIFQSRRFRQACRDYRLRQEFTTPYTPEQNGLIERFFRSLKDCTWQTNFRASGRRGGP